MRSASWSRFRAAVAESARGREYEDLGANDWPPLEVHAGDVHPKRVLLFTKPYLLRQWMETGHLPSGMAVLVRYGLPPKMVIDLVASTLRRWRSPASFIGDLDPLDLTVFLAYRRGDAELRQRARLPIQYAGIDDRWLDLCERHLRRGHPLENVSIRMSTVEREHLQVVEHLVGGDALEDLVGPRCLAMLKSGRKLELEGACNPTLYRPGFASLLLEHLREDGQRRR